MLDKWIYTMMNFINELRFKLEVLWIDHPHKIMFSLGFIIGAILL